MTGSTLLAVVFLQHPGPGQAQRFIGLFAGLSIAALVGIVANTRIADRRASA